MLEEGYNRQAAKRESPDLVEEALSVGAAYIVKAGVGSDLAAAVKVVLGDGGL